MKYLYAIIRHIWPRKPISRWEIIKEVRVWDSDAPDAKYPVEIRYVMRDQFGNMKTHVAKQ